MTNHSVMAQEILDLMWFDRFHTAADKRSLAAYILRILTDKAETFCDPSEGKTAAVRVDDILKIVEELEQF